MMCNRIVNIILNILELILLWLLFIGFCGLHPLGVELEPVIQLTSPGEIILN